MPAAFNKGATLIALKPVKAGSRDHHPGDCFAWRRYALTERRVAQLIDQKSVGELSQESFDLALQRRDPAHGVIPHGFTADGLKAVGIDVPDLPEPAPEDAPEETGDYDSLEARDGYRIGVKKAGIVNTYDVLSDTGRLNPSRLRGEKQLEAFLETLAIDKAKAVLADDPNTAAVVDVGYGDD